MPWLPDVQALDVVTMRPVMPKNTPMLTAVVCGIMRRYEFAGDPLRRVVQQHRGEIRR